MPPSAPASLALSLTSFVSTLFLVSSQLIICGDLLLVPRSRPWVQAVASPSPLIRSIETPAQLLVLRCLSEGWRSRNLISSTTAWWLFMAFKVSSLRFLATWRGWPRSRSRSIQIIVLVNISRLPARCSLLSCAWCSEMPCSGSVRLQHLSPRYEGEVRRACDS